MHQPPYRWVILAYTLVIQAVGVGSIYYCFSLLAVPWLEEFGKSRAEVMLAITLMQIANGLLGPVIGSAMDRFRLRDLVLFGALTYVAGYWLLSNATQFWQVYALYAVVFPIALALTGNLAAQVLITRWFESNRGLGLGISAMGTNLGGIIFPLFAAQAIAGGDWREVTQQFAIAGALVLVPLTWLVLSRRSPGELARAESPSTTPSVSTRSIVTSRTFIICAISFVFLNVAFNAVQTNLAVMANDLGIADWSGQLIALTAITMVIGKFSFGFMGDRVPHHYLYWTAGSIMIVGLFLLRGSPEPWVFATAIGIIGLAGGSLLPTVALMIGARFPLESFGRVMGLVLLIWSIGAFGPFLAGSIYDTTGSYDQALLLFAILLIPGLLLMTWLPAPSTALKSFAEE